MKTAVYNERIVSWPSAKVAEHNKKFAALIELGMEDFWIQSESAARNELRLKELEAFNVAENKKFDAATATVNTLNAHYAKKFGIKPVQPYIDKDYTYCRSGSTGIRLHFITGMVKQRRYTYNSRGELNTASLRKALEMMYEDLAAKHRIELERQTKINAAKSVMTNEMLDRVAKVSQKRFEDLTPIAQPNGKIAVTYEYWGQQSRQKYTTNIFLPMTIGQWEKYLAIQENHKNSLESLRNEIVNS